MRVRQMRRYDATEATTAREAGARVADAHHSLGDVAAGESDLAARLASH